MRSLPSSPRFASGSRVGTWSCSPPRSPRSAFTTKTSTGWRSAPAPGAGASSSTASSADTLRSTDDHLRRPGSGRRTAPESSSCTVYCFASGTRLAMRPHPEPSARHLQSRDIIDFISLAPPDGLSEERPARPSANSSCPGQQDNLGHEQAGPTVSPPGYASTFTIPLEAENSLAPVLASVVSLGFQSRLATVDLDRRPHVHERREHGETPPILSTPSASRGRTRVEGTPPRRRNSMRAAHVQGTGHAGYTSTRQIKGFATLGATRYASGSRFAPPPPGTSRQARDTRQPLPPACRTSTRGPAPSAAVSRRRILILPMPMGRVESAWTTSASPTLPARPGPRTGTTRA